VQRVAEAISSLCDAARALKGDEMVDPDDPHVIAEKELLAAAAQIELAAKMLADIKPRQQELQLDKDIKYVLTKEATRCLAWALSSTMACVPVVQLRRGHHHGCAVDHDGDGGAHAGGAGSAARACPERAAEHCAGHGAVPRRRHVVGGAGVCGEERRGVSQHAV
jgi:hypothetical protein